MEDDTRERRSGEAMPLVVVALAWLGAASLALLAGVRQISDDDYARTVIAETFAHSPRLDPSGTSWLPLPFWIGGGAMAIFGPSLRVARCVALASAAVSGALVFTGARSAGVKPRGAISASLLPLAIPLLPILGACPVPELLTASLLTFGVLASPDSRGAKPILAALAIAAATLSRYEAWPIAAAFAVWSLARVRQRGWIAAAAASIALSGELGWVAWNAVVHRDALRFVGRVAAYRSAVGGPHESVLAYVVAVLREAPIHVAGAAVALTFCGPFVRHRLRFAVVACAALVAGLTIAAQRGGAPTHHPERAVTTIWLLASVCLVAAAPEAIRRLTSQRVRALVVMGGIGLVVARGIARAPATLHDLGADRSVEIATGTAMIAAVPAAETILLVPLSYGYFATLAAFGRPEQTRVVSLRRLDPRGTRDEDPFATPDGLRTAAREVGATWILAEDEAQLRTARAIADDERAVASRALLHVRGAP